MRRKPEVCDGLRVMGFPWKGGLKGEGVRTPEERPVEVRFMITILTL